MASALRTDPRCFRLLAAMDPTVIELREWSRIAEYLGAEHIRLTNHMRAQLWRYFAAVLELDSDLGSAWLLELWEVAPTPDKASHIREATVVKLFKRNRIRRFDAAHLRRFPHRRNRAAKHFVTLAGRRPLSWPGPQSSCTTVNQFSGGQERAVFTLRCEPTVAPLDGSQPCGSGGLIV